jgi:hypothetical protein
MPVKSPTAEDPEYSRLTAQALREDLALLAAHEPPPAPAAPVLSPAEQAQRLRDLGPAAYLYAATAPVLGEGVSVEAWRVYLDDLLTRMGVAGSADPVARMLAVQLALADQAVGRLHLRAGTRVAAVETAAYHAAIGRLMGECRRTAVALQARLAGAARRAAAPRTRPRPPSGVRPARRVKKAGDSKLGSNNRIRGGARGRKQAYA